MYSVQTQVDGTWGPETEPVSVTADFLFSAKADTFCRGMAGQIDVGNYSNNDEMEWHIAPAIPYSRLVITVSICTLGRPAELLAMRQLADCFVWQYPVSAI